MTDLWRSHSVQQWRDALAAYDDVVMAQQVTRLPELDRWYHGEFAHAVAARRPAHVTLPELVRVTEWKMARGVWRAPNLVLVRGNDPATVIETSGDAIGRIPHETATISTLATLAGVGPATASAVMAAVAPAVYPFFDELVAASVPALGKVAWTLGYYRRYAAALRERAATLGGEFTAAMVERAVWASTGGKAGGR